MNFRTLKIIRLLTQVVTAVLKNEKLTLDANSARLEELGGIYIKFLQLVVLNLDPQSQASYKQLLNVYENSRPDPIDIIRYLRHELPYESFRQIAHIESKPFATGSFGQVYRATLTDGQQVAIKVLRPSVVRYLKYDLRLIGVLSWVYSLVDKQKMLNFKDMYRDFKKTTIAETDYVHEAYVMHSYHDTYQHHPYLVIPKPHLKFCTSHVLTQDFVSGLSLTKLLEMQAGGVNAYQYCAQAMGSDLEHLLRVVGSELFCKVLTGEAAQMDPHPGNIILLPGNRVALIDFGMSIMLRENRHALYELVIQYREFYSGNLAIEEFTLSALKCLAPELYAAIAQAENLFGHEKNNKKIFDKLKVTVKDIYNDENAQPLISHLLERRMIMKVLFFAINKGNRFGFSFDLSSTTLWKGVQTYFVLIARFDQSSPDKSVSVMLSMLNDVIVFGQQNGDKLMGTERALNPQEALETLSYWFDKMARNDPWLMNRITSGYIE